MARILFATWDGGGNVTPARALAAELADRGHDIRFIGHPDQVATLSLVGTTCGYRTARPFSIDTDGSPLALLGVFGDRRMGADVVGEVRAGHADLVVVDCLLFGVMDALRTNAIPYVILEHLHDGYLRRSLLRVPIGIGLRARGLPPIRLLNSAATTLVATLPDLDPLSAGPANLRQVGPFVRGVPATPCEPSILLSLSTFGYPRIRDVLQRVVDATTGLSVRVVVTTGPRVDPADLRVPDDVEVHRFVPHTELMPQMTMVVGHGGHSTTTLALAHDLPLLILPLFRLGDQPVVGRSVRTAGAGRVLRKSSRSAAIRRAIVEMLSQDSYRRNAARLGAEIRHLDGVRAGAREVDTVLEGPGSASA